MADRLGRRSLHKKEKDTRLPAAAGRRKAVLTFFPRLEFEQAVRQTRAERHARGFTCWGQFCGDVILPDRISSFATRDWRGVSKLGRQVEASWCSSGT